MSGSLRLPGSIQTIPEALAFWAERTPDAPAVSAIDGRGLSHCELQGVVKSVAARLTALGIQGDDQVAIVLQGGADACVALLGTMVVGVAVPFNPSATAYELTRDLERLRPRLLVTGGEAETMCQSVAAELSIATIAVDDLVAIDNVRPMRHASLPPAHPDRIAVILHTSGTTGLPKRVPRSHRTFVEAARAARLCSDLTPRDVALLATGLFNNSGIGHMTAALLNGGSCVIAPGFDPDQFPLWLDMHLPTWTVSTATELNLILGAASRQGRDAVAGPGSRLRAVRVGAQPMTPGTIERAEQSLRALVFEGYGMSEASNIAKSGPGPMDRRAGSCGRPMSGSIAVRVLDDAGADAAPGAPGQIVVRGSTVFPGYLDDPEANAAAFLPGGWFRTGDIGYFDEDGFLYLSGRLSELINRGGDKIAPAEVDRVLLRHPAVAEAAAFGVPDGRLGEDVVAAVVLKQTRSATARELRRWMLDRLSPFKAPRRIWFVDSLPRTATGKAQRGELRRRWSEEQGRR